MGRRSKSALCSTAGRVRKCVSNIWISPYSLALCMNEVRKTTDSIYKIDKFRRVRIITLSETIRKQVASCCCWNGILALANLNVRRLQTGGIFFFREIYLFIPLHEICKREIHLCRVINAYAHTAVVKCRYIGWYYRTQRIISKFLFIVNLMKNRIREQTGS